MERAEADLNPGPLVEPGAELTREQVARYSRQLLLPGFGTSAQRRLLRARVLVIGAGGLGCASVPSLAAAGVGTIGIADDDQVELSNLHRQTAHGIADLGRKKVDSLAETVAAIDPAIQVIRHPERIDESTIDRLLADYDLIVDGSDNFETRFLSNDAAERAGKPLVWGAILRYSGQASVAWAAHGPTYRDLFPTPPSPEDVLSCETAGVLPGVCAAIGAIIAGQVVTLITGVGEPLLGRLTSYDALTGRFREVAYRRAPRDARRVTESNAAPDAYRAPNTASSAGNARPDPGAITAISATELAQLLERDDPIELIDVREPAEAELARIPGSRLIPLGQLSGALDDIPGDLPVVVYCHHGPRSLIGARMLRSSGRADVSYLAGGIDAYAALDQRIARY